jgi:methionyl-tRNA synthetase
MNESTAWAYGAGVTALIVALVIWSAIWKAIALWKAARNNHLAWYIIMMILNTAGILEIIYIFAVGKSTEVVEKK